MRRSFVSHETTCRSYFAVVRIRDNGIGSVNEQMTTIQQPREHVTVAGALVPSWRAQTRVEGAKLQQHGPAKCHVPAGPHVPRP